MRPEPTRDVRLIPSRIHNSGGTSIFRGSVCFVRILWRAATRKADTTSTVHSTVWNRDRLVLFRLSMRAPRHSPAICWPAVTMKTSTRTITVSHPQTGRKNQPLTTAATGIRIIATVQRTFVCGSAPVVMSPSAGWSEAGTDAMSSDTSPLPRRNNASDVSTGTYSRPLRYGPVADQASSWSTAFSQ
jgi:hypothetical protein